MGKRTNLLQFLFALLLFIVSGVGISATDDGRLEFASKVGRRSQQTRVDKVNETEVFQQIVLNWGT